MARWSNWAGDLAYDDLAQVYLPNDLSGLKAAIADAAGRGLKLRAVGASHSWRNVEIDSTGGALLFTDQLVRTTPVDPATNTVEVEAGIRMWELNEILYAQGYSLRTMGDTDRQSIAGAISTDTHGSARDLPSIAEDVVGITLVTADGQEHQLSAPLDPAAPVSDEMKAARVSLGLLGVVYKVKLRVVPTVHLRHERKIVKMADEVRNNLDRLNDRLAQHRHVEYWYYPYTRGSAELFTRDEIAPTPPGDYRQRIADMIREALIADAYGHSNPEGLKGLFRLAMILRRIPDVREGPAHTILPFNAQTLVDLVKTQTMEYCFALPHLPAALEALEASIEFAEAQGTYISLPIHIRFVAPSSSFVSPNVHDPTASFSANFPMSRPGGEEWLRKLEELMRVPAIGARPHLGKLHYVREALPAAFEQVRQAFDPTGMFDNYVGP